MTDTNIIFSFSEELTQLFYIASMAFFAGVFYTFIFKIKIK